MRERPILMAGPLVRSVLAGTKTQTRRLIQAAGNKRHIDRLLGDWGLSEDPTPFAEGDRPWRPTRRPRLGDWMWTIQSDVDDTICEVLRCPFGGTGDRLYVRETWAEGDGDLGETTLYYAASNGPWAGPWRPSIHMPKRAARVWLEVTSIRVERLQAISDDDARAEGLPLNTVFPEKWTPSDGYLTPAGVANADRGEDCDEDGMAWWRGKRVAAWTTSAREAFAALWDSLSPEGARWEDNPWVWCVTFRRVEGSNG